jgi:hypothetical protein
MEASHCDACRTIAEMQHGFWTTTLRTAVRRRTDVARVNCGNMVPRRPASDVIKRAWISVLDAK